MRCSGRRACASPALPSPCAFTCWTARTSLSTTLPPPPCALPASACAPRCASWPAPVAAHALTRAHSRQIAQLGLRNDDEYALFAKLVDGTVQLLADHATLAEVVQGACAWLRAMCVRAARSREASALRPRPRVCLLALSALRVLPQRPPGSGGAGRHLRRRPCAAPGLCGGAAPRAAGPPATHGPTGQHAGRAGAAAGVR